MAITKSNLTGKRLPKGDYFYKEGDGQILPYGDFNCDGGFNHLSYQEARAIMTQVTNWALTGEHWVRGGFTGSVGDMEVVLMWGETTQSSRLGKLKIKDNANNLTLAAYRNGELYDDFFRVRKPFEEAEKRCEETRMQSSLGRVEKILQTTATKSRRVKR